MTTSIETRTRQYTFALVPCLVPPIQDVEGPRPWELKPGLATVQAQVKATAGTWIRPISGMDARFQALVACPNCNAIMALAKGVHTIGPRSGIVRQPIACDCGFNCVARLNGFAEKSLYSCAFTAEGKAQILYMHATSAEECRKRLVGQGHKSLSILAIGLALGYYEQEVNGRVVLSTN